MPEALVRAEAAEVFAEYRSRELGWRNFEGRAALVVEGFCPNCADWLDWHRTVAVGRDGDCGWCHACRVGWRATRWAVEHADGQIGYRVEVEHYDPSGTSGSYGWADIPDPQRSP